MINANVNAIGIIASLLFTITILLNKSESQNINLKKILKSILIVSGVSIANITFSTHMCKEGQPFYQWLIPGICIFAITLLIENKKIKILSQISLIVLSFLLCQHFNQLVHSERYTGRATSVRIKGQGEKPKNNMVLWHTIFTGIYERNKTI